MLSVSTAAENKRVAVLLAGCGVYDGTEIQESTAALFHLSVSYPFLITLDIFLSV
jgi:hypothetical protein